MTTPRDNHKVSHVEAAVRAFKWYAVSLAMTLLIIFLPAGTICWWNGWLYTASLFIPMLFALFYMALKDPELLMKRLQMKEKEKEQKIYYRISLVFFVAAFSMPGLDYRFGWSHVPVWLVMTSLVITVSGYALFLFVMRVNSYASRIIEIQDGQQVIDTGPYSVIRHPLYCAALFIYIPSPLVLGSYYALIIMIALPFILVYRIRNEEAFLIEGLPGYREYMEKVRYRLIPYIW